MEINDIDASVETLSEITDKSSGIDTEKNLVKQIEPEKEEMVDDDKSSNLERTLFESRVEITESNKEDVECNDSMVQDVRCLKRTRIALSKVGGDAVSKVSSDTLDTVSKVSDENKALSPPEKAVSYPLESKETPDKSAPNTAPSTAQPMSPQNDKKLETDVLGLLLTILLNPLRNLTLSQSNPSTSSSSTPTTRSSITSPLVQPSPPHSSYEPSQKLSSEKVATSWSMSCDSSDDEIVDGADDRDSDVESDRETSIKNTCKLETNKHKSKDLGDLASDKVKETRELQSDKGKSSPKRGELDSDMVEIGERSKKPSSDNVQSTFDLVEPNDMCESNKIDCDNSDEGKSSDIQEITIASEVASPKHASAELLHLPVLENFEDEKPIKQLPGVTCRAK
ncbi:transcription initiation factor TFIID subunit 11-like [Diaphorina citri]|uniref:Transcription initiation factor TFIID subunit 11-like n=1 Tax=Diaphorina citri TaxID=121845 RepID=A0A1S4EEZ1_DIACI|nr:transcription initiation factor TFIID subunit 11-like [Diaphorina citri]